MPAEKTTDKRPVLVATGKRTVFEIYDASPEDRVSFKFTKDGTLKITIDK